MLFCNSDLLKNESNDYKLKIWIYYAFKNSKLLIFYNLKGRFLKTLVEPHMEVVNFLASYIM